MKLHKKFYKPDWRTARCVKDTHTQPSSAVLFRLTAPSLDPTAGTFDLHPRYRAEAYPVEISSQNSRTRAFCRDKTKKMKIDKPA